MILYILILLILYLICINCKNKLEYFNSNLAVPLNNNYKKTFNINPIQMLPPGTTNINLKFKNKRLEANQTEYCEDNPTCYPCPGWRHIGAPMCLA